MPAPALAPLLAWAREQGLEGEPVVHSARPWSLTVRLGDVWLKRCGPAATYEARLLALLPDEPSLVLPLAAHPDGLLALPHAGEQLRGRDDALDRWPGLLAEHAELQQRLQPLVPAALEAGVPDLRPARVPGAVAALRPDLPPAFVHACAELAAHDVAPTVQHDDLHDGNVLVGGPPGTDGVARVTDWGDSSVGHPFGVLQVTLRSLRARHGLDDRALARLTDAYLEPWGGPQHRESAVLAQRVQAAGRALSWSRALVAADDEERGRWQEGVATWLERL